jgi:arylsulfatase A-like enzyme
LRPFSFFASYCQNHDLPTKFVPAGAVLLNRIRIPTHVIRAYVFGAALAIGLCSLSAGETSNHFRPNILMIAIDDQNDWIGCLGGHPQSRTPNIDRLAKRGTVFLNAHCQSPLCNPSRVSLLTSRRPSSTGVYGLSPALRDADGLEDVVTLPQHLRQSGYNNLMAGKIYHGGYGRRPVDNEFDVVGPPADVGARPKSPLVSTPSGHPLVDWGTFPHKDEEKGDYKLASWTVSQLQMTHDRPFFMSVGFFLPHVPCYVTQSWYDLFPAESLQLPAVMDDDRADTPKFSWYLHWKLPEPRLKFLQQSEQWTNLVRSYLASTAFVDAQIGRILDTLDASPYANNTIVVLWSDHGWHLGEKGITGKNSLWDRGTRVPLIFAGPGVSPDSRCAEPAELLDIYPTLSELCHLEQPEGLEGHSLLPQLKDSAHAREWPAITTHNHDNHGIRSRDWRYIRYADGSEELYNMVEDPNEWTNLASRPEHSQIIAEHRQWIPKVNRKPVPGSRDRILLYDASTGQSNWEGKDILPNSPIPEIED